MSETLLNHIRRLLVLYQECHMRMSEVMNTYLPQLGGASHDLIKGTFNSEFIERLRDKLKEL